MKRVQEFGRQIVASRVYTTLIALALGILLVLNYQGQQRPAPAVHASQLETVALNSVIKPPNRLGQRHINCQAVACLALTFDDGPNEASTPHIVDILAQEDARGTFFIIGSRVVGQEALLRRMYALGDELGNHSWSHPNFSKLNAAQMKDQVDQAEAAIAAAGVPAPQLFRPPYGEVSQTMLATLKLPIILWNVDPKDWQSKDPLQIIHDVESQVHPGAIVILHDSLPITATAIPQLVHELRAKYELVTVSQLLGLGPDSRGEFFGHPPK